MNIIGSIKFLFLKFVDKLSKTLGVTVQHLLMITGIFGVALLHMSHPTATDLPITIYNMIPRYPP